MNIYWNYKFALIYSENLEYGLDSPRIKKNLIYIKINFLYELHHKLMSDLKLYFENFWKTSQLNGKVF